MLSIQYNIRVIIKKEHFKIKLSLKEIHNIFYRNSENRRMTLEQISCGCQDKFKAGLKLVRKLKVKL